MRGWYLAQEGAAGGEFREERCIKEVVWDGAKGGDRLKRSEWADL